MPAYCPTCGRPLEQVAKAHETIPTCTACNAEFLDPGLGWRRDEASAAHGEAEAVVSVKKLVAEDQVKGDLDDDGR